MYQSLPIFWSYECDYIWILELESAGQGFWHPDPVTPRYRLPRPGPDRKIVNFVAPTPDRRDYIFPGPDRTETI